MSSLPTSNNQTQPRRFGGALSPSRIPWRLCAGFAVSLVVGLLIVGILTTIWRAADLFGNQKTSTLDLFHLLRMSAVQAALSVILALTTGGTIAICLSRLRFKGQSFVLALLSAGLVLPTVIVAFGLLAIWGRAGVVNQAAAWFGLGKLPFSIFGLQGILAAHTVLNGAFAARIFFDRLQAIPVHVQKLGRSLSLSEMQRFTILDWPALKAAAPGLSATIFLMCFTSFSVVLLLGGGPNNATFEVAIYEAARVDFDLHRAAILAATQLGFCLLIIVPTAGLKSTSMMIGAPKPIFWPARGPAKRIALLVLGILTIAYASPIIATIYKGVDPNIFAFMLKPKFINALLTSLFIASCSAILSTTLAIILALGRAELVYQNMQGKTAIMLRTLLSAPVFSYLAMPAIVLGLGFFLLARFAQFDTTSIGMHVVILANALMTLPLANATLGPPIEKIANKHGKLVRSLNLRPAERFTRIELPLLRREIAYIFTLGFCFSFGDLSVIALFGTGDFTTLPWLMYLSLGAYRTNDAAMIASIMLMITIGFFYLFPKFLGNNRHA